MTAKVPVTKFRINVPQADLDDLHRRLENVRWADDFGNSAWTYGVEREWLEEMVVYWRDRYDWRAEEAEMNRYSHHRCEIDGIPIHFIHVRGKGPRPRPLILSHGWPWTFWDYKQLIEPLTDPAAHGGDAGDAFDLVVPSLPGFGFSTPLRTTGVDAPRIAELWVKLMRDVLGYDRFGAAGGDWGALITTWLGHAHHEHLTGIYSTLCVIPGLDSTQVPASAYADDEQWMPVRDAESFPTIISHVTVHSRDPQTLAYALADSPVGTAAWLWERRRAWSDCNGDVLQAFDRDFLCTLASIYWLTGTVGSSLRIYFEHFKTGWVPPKAHERTPAIAVPTGYGVFPKDVSHLPRALAAAHTNLRRWTVMPSGGHFGPAEKPALVVNELREFFRDLY
jgi:pimeloyl-ACP methyl ester carboxylesterase